MKKKYVAPTISFEYYELTQSIAACETNVGFKNSECVASNTSLPDQWRDFASIGWFISGHCDDYEQGMDENDGICYHTNLAMVFSS